MINWMNREVGRLWILFTLDSDGPRKLRQFRPRHIAEMRERGLITPALRVKGGWEITDKGCAVIGAARAALK